MGRKLVERRFKTLPRLFARSAKLFWPMLEKTSDLHRFSSQTLVRRLLRLGPGSLERRLKTLRRLFHPLLREMCAVFIYDDAYFPFLLFY